MAWIVASARSMLEGSMYGTMPRPRGQKALVSGIIDQSIRVATSFSIHFRLWVSATSSMGWVCREARYGEPFASR